MNICIIGCGYVGLVSGAIFSELGNKVVCVDRNETRINSLNQGKIPIYEDHLEESIQKSIKDGNLNFTNDSESAIQSSDLIFICVGTPKGSDGEANLGAIDAVAADIGKNLNGYKIVVNKSTVPIGTAERVRRIITAHRQDSTPFDVASNPEFLREGSAVMDTRQPDRIVIGTDKETVSDTLSALYAPLEAPIISTSIPSAELIKYASNAYLATKISFINAISQICENIGANVEDISEGMGSDRRIGHHFLQAGLGWGGSCFGKDIDALIFQAKEHNCEFKLLEEVVNINKYQSHRFIDRLALRLEGLADKNIAVWGLSFKPNTDDVRDSKALQIIESLRTRGANVKAYDPVATQNAISTLGHDRIEYCDNIYDTVKDSDAIILATDWEEFIDICFRKVRRYVKTPVFFDGRNMFPTDYLEALGFEYFGIGK